VCSPKHRFSSLCARLCSPYLIAHVLEDLGPVPQLVATQGPFSPVEQVAVWANRKSSAFFFSHLLWPPPFLSVSTSFTPPCRHSRVKPFFFPFAPFVHSPSNEVQRVLSLLSPYKNDHHFPLTPQTPCQISNTFSDAGSESDPKSSQYPLSLGKTSISHFPSVLQLAQCRHACSSLYSVPKFLYK